MDKPLIKFGLLIVNVNNITTVTPLTSRALSKARTYEFVNTLGEEKFEELIEDDSECDIAAYEIALVYEGGMNATTIVVSVEDCERLYGLFGN